MYPLTPQMSQPQYVQRDNCSTGQNTISKRSLQTFTLKKRNPGLVFEGCSFHKKRTNKTSIEWRCSFYRTRGCNMCCKTTLNNQLIKFVGSHNHSANLPLDVKKPSESIITTTAQGTPPLNLNHYPSEPLSSVKIMRLVDPDQWPSSKLNTDVTSTPQRGLLPGPIVSSGSALGQTTSDKDLVLREPDPEDSSCSNSVVTSIPQRPLLSEPLGPPITPSEVRMQNLGQSVLQHYVHTLNNNSTNNVVNVYPQPQVYEQYCQPGHDSPDPGYRNPTLETPIVEATQTKELPDQRPLESLNIAKRKIKSLEQVNQTKTSRLEKTESENKTLTRTNTSLKRENKSLKQANQTKTMRLEKAASEINSLKREFKSFKGKYSDCYKVSNKSFYLKEHNDAGYLVFIRINGEYDVDSEEEDEGQTNALTRTSRTSRKEAKKLKRNWTEHRGNDEESEDESDDEAESQTEEESEESEADGEEISEDED